jgi:hypothetical protein
MSKVSKIKYFELDEDDTDGDEPNEQLKKKLEIEESIRREFMDATTKGMQA